ncbi:hypothetical protein ACLKA6_001888, partial [Drosophila palustris]
FGSPGQGSVSLWWFPRKGCQVHNAVRRGTQKIYAQDHVVYDGQQHQEGYASTTVAELHCRDEGFVHCGATLICHADLGSYISSSTYGRVCQLHSRSYDWIYSRDGLEAALTWSWGR